MTRPSRRRFLASLTGTVAVAGVAGCSSEGSSPATTLENGDPAQSSKDSGGSSLMGTRIGPYGVRIDAVRTATRTYQNEQISVAPSGTKFVEVQLTVERPQDEDHLDTPDLNYDVKLQTDAGFTYEDDGESITDTTHLSSAHWRDPSSENQVTGALWYTIPESERPTELMFELTSNEDYESGAVPITTDLERVTVQTATPADIEIVDYELVTTASGYDANFMHEVHPIAKNDGSNPIRIDTVGAEFDGDTMTCQSESTIPPGEEVRVGGTECDWEPDRMPSLEGKEGQPLVVRIESNGTVLAEEEFSLELS